MVQKTPDILKKIISRKHKEILESKNRIPIERLIELSDNADKPRGFYNALKNKVLNQQSAIIAEIKKASPSKGVLRENFEPVEIAKSYEAGGACCLSILTDRDFFQGDPQYLIKARAAVSIPVIRKDFIINEYQIYQSKLYGADCILLIVSALSNSQLKEFKTIAESLDLDVLVEIHNQDELERIQPIDFPFIGINNRNLSTFEVDLKTTKELSLNLKDKLVVSESGIKTRAVSYTHLTLPTKA